MRLNRDKTSFGRHETFPLRYGWLTKGFEALKANPDLFDHPEVAMVTLGVGRNMVNAIQYWLQAVGVVNFAAGQNQPELHLNRSQSTLKSDVSTLLRLYAPVAGRSDEHLDTPLAALQLIEPEGGGNYRSLRLERPYLPAVALHFALAQRFAADPQPAIPVRAIVYGGDGWAAVGAVFRLSEEGLMALMVKVVESYPGCYELRDTAGVHQIYRGANLPEPLAILRDYYQEAAP